MTPLTHQTMDMHVKVYHDQLGADIRAARSIHAPLHRTRRAIARSLVRTGAWLLPDKPEMVGNTVLVLPQPQRDTSKQVAA